MLNTQQSVSGYPFRAVDIFQEPWLLAMACISIRLGIAANSIIFSMVNAALFGDLPVREPQRLVTITSVMRSTLSYPDYRDFQKLNSVFEGIAADFPVVPVRSAVWTSGSDASTLAESACQAAARRLVSMQRMRLIRQARNPNSSPAARKATPKRS